MGIEPTCSAWKADILPLNYTRTQRLHIITLKFGFVNSFWKIFLFFLFYVNLAEFAGHIFSYLLRFKIIFSEYFL